MIRVSEIAEHWFGLCKKPPALRSVPALLTTSQEAMVADRSAGSGPDSDYGRIRLGVTIAAESITTIVRNRYLFVFSFLSGLAMFF